MNKVIAAAQVKAAVKTLLRPLDADLVRLILADLLVAYAAVQNPAPIAAETGLLTKTDKLLLALSDHPGMAIVDLAETIYGDTDKAARTRVRSLIAQQAKRKPPTVESFGTGKWRVVKK